METNQSNDLTVIINPPSIYYTAQQNQRELQSVSASVATLLLRKSTRFHDKKTLDSPKKTRSQKETYTE